MAVDSPGCTRCQPVHEFLLPDLAEKDYPIYSNLFGRHRMLRAVIHLTLRVIAIATTGLLLAMPARGQRFHLARPVMKPVPQVDWEHI